jgi:ABC-2 type transport system permease protein
MRIINIVTIAEIYSKWQFRRPLTFFFIAMFMPVSIIVPMLLLVPENSWSDVIVGALIFSVIGGGISDVTLNVSLDREIKRSAFFVSRGVKPMEYMLGILLGGASYTFAGAGVILLIGLGILGFSATFAQVLSMLGLVAIAWISSANLGFILALYGPKDYRVAASLSDVLLFSLSFLAPVYYPVEVLPVPLRTLSYPLYTTHLGILGRSVLRAEPLNAFSLAFVLIFSAALFFISARGMRWNRD